MTVPSFYVFSDLFTVCALALSVHDVGVYLVSQVAVQLELAHKDDQRQQHQNGRHAKAIKPMAVLVASLMCAVTICWL